jgi:hypothetical protein
MQGPRWKCRLLGCYHLQFQSKNQPYLHLIRTPCWKIMTRMDCQDKRFR